MHSSDKLLAWRFSSSLRCFLLPGSNLSHPNTTDVLIVTFLYFWVFLTFSLPIDPTLKKFLFKIHIKHKIRFKNNEWIKHWYCYLSSETQKEPLGPLFFFQISTCLLCNICLRPPVTVYTLWQLLRSNVATYHCFRLDLIVRLSTDCIPYSSFKLLLHFIAECATVGLTSLLFRLSLRAAYKGSTLLWCYALSTGK